MLFCPTCPISACPTLWSVFMRLSKGYHNFDSLSRYRQRLFNLPETRRTTQRWQSVGPALTCQAGKKITLYIAIIREMPGWTKAESSNILTEIFRSFTLSSNLHWYITNRLQPLPVSSCLIQHSSYHLTLGSPCCWKCHEKTTPPPHIK